MHFTVKIILKVKKQTNTLPESFHLEWQCANRVHLTGIDISFCAGLTIFNLFCVQTECKVSRIQSQRKDASRHKFTQRRPQTKCNLSEEQAGIFMNLRHSRETTDRTRVSVKLL